jgi:hypothetical protein
MQTSHVVVLVAALAIVTASGPAYSWLGMDLESGIVQSGYNDVRIPGKEGTLFSLSEELDAKAKVFFRARVRYALSDRSHVMLLIAPLWFEASGRVAKEINFAGVIFPANAPLDATYRFDSYRLTYRYDVYLTNRFEFGLGFTAKIRDAEIWLASGDLAAEKANVGFVPLLNFRLLWGLTDRFGLLLEGDALAAPQGRAEDVLAALIYKVSERLGVKAGYRILEGGADNDEVYNFALLHYAVVGIMFKP